MYANAERTRVRWRGCASAGEGARAPARGREHRRRRARAFTLRLMSLVACKITVVGGRGFTGPGKYHCTIELLFDWFGSVCFANKNKNCQL